MVFLNDSVLNGAWSPDQQLLILATVDEIISLSRDFEIQDRNELRTKKDGKGLSFFFFFLINLKFFNQN